MRNPRRLASAQADIDMATDNYVILPIEIPSSFATACFLGRLTIKAIDRTGCNSCAAYLARKADGTMAVTTPGTAKNFITPDGITDSGAVVYDLGNLPYAPDTQDDEGFYVVAALDAGSASLTAILDVSQ